MESEREREQKKCATDLYHFIIYSTHIIYFYFLFYFLFVHFFGSFSVHLISANKTCFTLFFFYTNFIYIWSSYAYNTCCKAISFHFNNISLFLHFSLSSFIYLFISFHFTLFFIQFRSRQFFHLFLILADALSLLLPSIAQRIHSENTSSTEENRNILYKEKKTKWRK